MLTKNCSYEIEITGLTSEGMGVGRHGGVPIFVKGAAPGDVLTAKIIKAKKGYAYGRVESVIKCSGSRAVPVCPVYGKCGGCVLQHMNYDAQLAAKAAKVEDSLRRIGGFVGMCVDEIIAASGAFRYRNKSVFPVGVDAGGRAVCGLYAAHSHRLVPVEDCHIAHEGVAEVLRAVEGCMAAYGVPVYNEVSHTGLVRHVMVRTAFATGQVMVVLVVNGDSLPRSDEITAKLRKIPSVRSVYLNINRARTNVIFGEQTHLIWGEPYIHEILCGVKFAISATSFFQVNPVMTELIYGKALEFAGISPSSVVLDLYCGIGAISLIAARCAARVVGVEVSEAAVADARANAVQNGITGAEFVAGKVEDTLGELLAGGFQPDVVILDPPRKGCDPAVIKALLCCGAKRIVYVSCDPATLARDLKLLCESGLYCVAKVVAADAFPQTAHVESIVLLMKNSV